MRDEIRKYLKEHGMSVTELAKKSGLHYNTIYDYLKGGGVTESTLEKIARAIGKKLDINLKQVA